MEKKIFLRIPKTEKEIAEEWEKRPFLQYREKYPMLLELFENLDNMNFKCYVNENEFDFDENFLYYLINVIERQFLIELFSGFLHHFKVRIDRAKKLVVEMLYCIGEKYPELVNEKFLNGLDWIKLGEYKSKFYYIYSDESEADEDTCMICHNKLGGTVELMCQRGCKCKAHFECIGDYDFKCLICRKENIVTNTPIRRMGENPIFCPLSGIFPRPMWSGQLMNVSGNSFEHMRMAIYYLQLDTIKCLIEERKLFTDEQLLEFIYAFARGNGTKIDESGLIHFTSTFCSNCGYNANKTEYKKIEDYLNSHIMRIQIDKLKV
jgi:hypothetical protein